MTAVDTGIETIRVVPLTPGFGAVLHGVDGKQRQSDDAITTLRAALLRYKVVFLPNQHLSVQEQFEFASRFEEPFDTALLDDAEEVGLNDRTGVVSHFHADYMYMAEPPKFSMLQMLEQAEVGGDTIWMDLEASYHALSESFRAFIEPLRVHHTHPDYFKSDDQLRAEYRRSRKKELSDEALAARRAALTPHEHPLVRRIPETGTINYWVSERHTAKIIGLTKWESDAVLSLLFRQQMRPEFAVRWRWSVGDIAFWDHRRTLHAGVADYGDHSRVARRATVGRERPIPA